MANKNNKSEHGRRASQSGGAMRKKDRKQHSHAEGEIDGHIVKCKSVAWLRYNVSVFVRLCAQINKTANGEKRKRQN